MTREEALNIIEKESLTCYSWFGKEMRENWYVLKDLTAINYVHGEWVTYIIGERNCIEDYTHKYFDSEEEAMDDFIRRLRLAKNEIDSELAERRKKELARETEGSA